MSEIIERIARSLCRFTWERQFEDQNLDACIEAEWQNHTDAAVVMLKSIREPTRDMIVAAMITPYPTTAEAGGVIEQGEAAVRLEWQAMIDAALPHS